MAYDRLGLHVLLPILEFLDPKFSKVFQYKPTFPDEYCDPSEYDNNGYYAC